MSEIGNERKLNVNLNIPEEILVGKCRNISYNDDYRFVDHCMLRSQDTVHFLLAGHQICNDIVVSNMSSATHIVIHANQYKKFHDQINNILKMPNKWKYFVENVKTIMEYYFNKYNTTPEYGITNGRIYFKIINDLYTKNDEIAYNKFIRYVVLKKIRILYMSLLYEVELDKNENLKSQIEYLKKHVKKDVYSLMTSTEFQAGSVLFNKEDWSLNDFKNYYNKVLELHRKNNTDGYEFLICLLPYFSYGQLDTLLITAHNNILKEIPQVGKTEEERQKEQEMEKQRIQEIIKSYIPKTKNKTRPLRVFSRHPSHAPLRDLVINYNVLLRLGGRTDSTKDIDPDGYLIINSKEAVQNSASKKRMKECFAENNIKTAEYVITNNFADLLQFCNKFSEKTKFIAKPILGSRGRGILMFQNAQELLNHFEQNSPANYVIEKYYTYSKEYRFHVTKNGCFYTCRKMHKADTPKEDRHIRNDSNCVWIVEENNLYEKPTSFDKITQECVKALNAVGLDYGACDVRVNKEGEFIIIEINSAPSFGERTLIEFEKIFPQLIDLKLQEKIKQ